MKETKKLAASYFKNFKCIGGACEDTCCVGWQIMIDEKSYKKYKKVKNPEMKKRLDKAIVVKKNSISEDEMAKIKLKNNNCSFLNKTGLCDLYSELGEGYLSKTCRLYPRTINEVNDTREYALAFSCPEAARCILLNEEGIELEEIMEMDDDVTISGAISLNESKPRDWKDELKPIRKKLLEVFKDRSKSIITRFETAEHVMKAVHQNSSNPKKIEESLKKVIKLPEQKNKYFLQPKKAMRLLEKVKAVKGDKKWQGQGYEKLYEKLLSGLSGDKEAAYEANYKKYVEPFLETYSYIFENYFVNYVFERLVPLDGNTPLESYQHLELYKDLLILNLTGLSGAEKGLTKESVVGAVQAISKNFDHNELYIVKLLK